MDIEITSKKENPLLERLEVEFSIEHAGEKTPTRDSVRAKLVEMLKASKETLIVDHMESDFGRTVTRGYAKVYKTPQAAQSVERKHQLARNKLIKKGKEE